MRDSISGAFVVCLLVLTACGATPNDTEASGAAAGPGSGGSGAGGLASGGSSAAGTSSAGTNSAGTSGAGTSSGGSSAGTGGASGNGGSANGGGSNFDFECPQTQEPGSWVDVTPPELDLESTEVGVVTTFADPVRKSDIYANVQFNGVWKSTDCGLTYVKMNTGTNGDKLDTGSPWGGAIDPNINRDPETPPTLYLNQGYGALSLWKSTDGGVNWSDAWAGKVFAADGVTNISSDVGNDLAGPSMLSTDSPDHLIIFLHGYFGSGGNNGIFETTNGGDKWILHEADFNFQPHSDLLTGIDAQTWIVSHNEPWPGGTIYRTTDGGDTWTQSSGDSSVGMGHSIAISGSTVFMGSDAIGGIYKSTDQGGSWLRLEDGGWKVGWVAVTDKNVYTTSGEVQSPPVIRHAPLDDDTNWVTDTVPAEMFWNGVNDPAVTFDGVHAVILAPQHKAGLWRYVEP